ncbi:MAG: N-acetylglucosamine-6-phosphate deacetylase [Ruminococcaceae bacterium]|nr:N-acetylglucosamine-6-phosphate deacetylase [Oscillospiraceae bacterium]
MKCIKGGIIVLPKGTVEGKAVLYDEKILGIVDEKDIPSDAEIICAKGCYVAPGLVDVHIHGYMNEDASDGKPEGVRKMAEGVVKNGVTTFLPTTMTVSMDEINAALDICRSLKEESKSWKGAYIAGVNAEGPFINASKKGAQAEEHIKAPDADWVIKNSDIIKLVTIAPETEGGYEAIKKIRENSDVRVSVGHTDATFEQANKAFECGADHVTHLFNAQTALHHRKPGVVGAGLASDAYAELIADTFHVHPGLFSLVAKCKGDKLVLITDCTRAGGMPDGEYSLGGQPIFLKGIQCLLADGTIAGSVLKLNEAVKNVLDNTDLSVAEVVAAASLNPANSIGMGDTKGSIEEGKDADIIIADMNFEIKKTIIQGEVRYEA